MTELEKKAEERRFRAIQRLLKGTHYKIKEGRKQPESDNDGHYVKGYAIFDCSAGTFVDGFRPLENAEYCLTIDEAEKIAADYADNPR